MSEPIRQEGYYVLIAYKDGNRDGKSYLVDLCGGIDTAIERAEIEVKNKEWEYSVVVYAKNFQSGEMDEVYTTISLFDYVK